MSKHGKSLENLALYALKQLWTRRRHSRQNRTGLSILPAPELELRSVRAEDFQHLDLAYYNNHQRRLEKRNFRFLSDLEDVTMLNARRARRTFMRFMVHEDGNTLANIYHFLPSWLGSFTGARWSKVVDFETQFTDGKWVCTSNAESAGHAAMPVEIDALYLPHSTTLDHLLELHADRLERYLANRQGVHPVSVSTKEDAIRSQCQQHAIKSLFRQDPHHHRRGTLERTKPSAFADAGRKAA